MTEELDFEEIQESVDEILEEEFRFRDAVMDLIQGEEIFTLEGFLTALLGQFGENWKQEKQILLSILVLGIVAALLTNFSNIFQTSLSKINSSDNNPPLIYPYKFHLKYHLLPSPLSPPSPFQMWKSKSFYSAYQLKK